MLFYLVQMTIPGCIQTLKAQHYQKTIHILFVPLFFPFWLVLKMVLGEKKADLLVPSIAFMDDTPTWVGGGDVRLGILLGLILGPVYFWWTIGIGYTI